MSTSYSVSYLDKDNVWHNIGDTPIGGLEGIQPSYDNILDAKEAYALAILNLGHITVTQRLRIDKTETVHSTVEETNVLPWQLKKILENSILLAGGCSYRVARIEAHMFVVFACLGGPRHNFQYSLANASLKGNDLYVYCGNELDKFQVYVPYQDKKENE